MELGLVCQEAKKWTPLKVRDLRQVPVNPVKEGLYLYLIKPYLMLWHKVFNRVHPVKYLEGSLACL